MNNIDIANHPDDTTPNAFSENIGDLITFLEKSSKDLHKWFDDSLMKIPVSVFYWLGLAKRCDFKIDKQPMQKRFSAKVFFYKVLVLLFYCFIVLLFYCFIVYNNYLYVGCILH